jgi:hypothetical protein
MDKKLWKLVNYENFLTARRDLLADAANEFLSSLLETEPDQIEITTQRLPLVERPIAGGIESEEEERALGDCNQWVTEQGLTAGEVAYELVDENGSLLALIDLAWPDGLQSGLTDPIAILIDEGDEIEDLVNARGFRYFTSIDAFQEYVGREILALAEVG